MEKNRGRGILLWLLGVPIPVIIILWLFFGHWRLRKNRSLQMYCCRLFFSDDPKVRAMKGKETFKHTICSIQRQNCPAIRR
jgi:hypothetical protein